MTNPAVSANGDATLAPGQAVGEYTLEEEIGAGGFGTVYRAVHPLIGKQVAIKVLSRAYSAQPEMVSRFVAEARAVNQIRHRHIIDIFGFGQLDDGRHYYVMELLEGQALDAYLAASGPIPLEQAVPILRGVARALDAAHAKGIIHRDLKPENVYLVPEPDGGWFPKLLDFGIAKAFGDAPESMHKTRTGAPIGTPYYMSPEQCRGRDVDHRTDIYAFGCVAYELVTGAVPFDGEDYLEILMKQMAEPAIAPSLRAPAAGIPPAVDDAIAWMMAKEPAARPDDLASAMAALEQGASSSGVALPIARTSASMIRSTPSSLGVGVRTPAPVARTVATAATVALEPVAVPVREGGGGAKRRGMIVAAAIAIVAVVITAVVIVGGRETATRPATGPGTGSVTETGTGPVTDAATVTDPVAVTGPVAVTDAGVDAAAPAAIDPPAPSAGSGKKPRKPKAPGTNKLLEDPFR